MNRCETCDTPLNNGNAQCHFCQMADMEYIENEGIEEDE